jgi:diaminohydroxyphosphoribosylaminopyrimidine deaminase/5-amino-6-(5-phosphoribosylamino)uracil reductase
VLNDADYMARALLHAERGRGRTAPNPIVGAVVLSEDGVVVGTGHHGWAGEAHAEVHALDEAGSRARGGTLYCTLEPCPHVGRTGPCTSRILEAGIRRVVAAVQDPNPRVSGRGFAQLRERGVDVSEGVLAEAAARANAPFFTWIRKHRPFVTMKVALSSDGRVAERSGAPTSITGPDAARQIHRDRAAADAIGIGVGTVLADDPLLTPRGAWRARPLTRVVFDRTLRTPTQARLFSTLDAGPVVILCPEQGAASAEAVALEHAGARVEPVSGDFLPAALSRLADLDVTSLIVEGGPTLHEAFWRAKLVDQVQIYVGRLPIDHGPNGGSRSSVPWLDASIFPWSELAWTRIRWFGTDLCLEADVDDSLTRGAHDVYGTD